MLRLQDRINRAWRKGPQFDLPLEGIIVYSNPVAPLITAYKWSPARRQLGGFTHTLTTESLRNQQACHFVIELVFCPDTQTMERQVVITVDEHAHRTLLAEHFHDSFPIYLGPDED